MKFLSSELFLLEKIPGDYKKRGILSDEPHFLCSKIEPADKQTWEISAPRDLAAGGLSNLEVNT